MIDKNTIGIIKKPHISYDTFSESWLCSSEHGPWDVCIGAGESVVEAYRSWGRKCPRMIIDRPRHCFAPCQDGGKWRLTQVQRMCRMDIEATREKYRWELILVTQ